MNWHKYTRLSYAETRKFLQERSITGIVLIVIVCLVAGLISLYFSGKLKMCTATPGPQFLQAQVKEGGEGCVGETVSVGELVSKPSFTYVVATELREYRDEVLQCKIQKISATINLLSFAVPQFSWSYEISCSRPTTCCPAKIQNTPIAKTSCFFDQKVMLRIQQFSVNYRGSDLLNAAVSNYSTLNTTISTVSLQVCPNNEQITVLRFDETSYFAFSSSNICTGTEGSTSTFEDKSIADAINRIRVSVNKAIDYDLIGFRFTGCSYMCFSCSHTHDIGQLLLDLLIAISAIGSVTCSLVLWLLKVTQRAKPPMPNLSMSQIVNEI